MIIAHFEIFENGDIAADQVEFKFLEVIKFGRTRAQRMHGKFKFFKVTFKFVNTFLLLQSQKRRFEIQNVVKELKSIINNECNWGPEQFGTTCRVTFFSFVQKSLHPTVYIASSSSCFAIPNHYLSSFYKKYFSFFTQLIKTSKITVFPGIKNQTRIAKSFLFRRHFCLLL